jgi:hypothetical protein
MYVQYIEYLYYFFLETDDASVLLVCDLLAVYGPLIQCQTFGVFGYIFNMLAVLSDDTNEAE